MGKKKDLKEYRKWLKEDSKEAIAWRTSSEHTRAVSEMVSAYASVEGGEAANLVWSRINAEKVAVKKEQVIKEEQEVRSQILKEAARADWLANGGKPETFDRDWSSLEKSLLQSGRAGKIINEALQNRRSRSARTF